MLDGRFDPAFHQAFISSDTHPAQLPVRTWVMVVAMIAAIGVLAMLGATSLP